MLGLQLKKQEILNTSMQTLKPTDYERRLEFIPLVKAYNYLALCLLILLVTVVKTKNENQSLRSEINQMYVCILYKLKALPENFPAPRSLTLSLNLNPKRSVYDHEFVIAF